MATRQTQLDIKGRVEKRVQDSSALLERMGMTTEQFERVALNALVTNPALANCEPESLDVAVLQCIQAGLMPDGKEAAIVPFNDRERGKIATLIPMVKGDLKLVRRAVPNIVINAKTVYRGDEFAYEEGITPILRHVPNPDVARTHDNIIAVYARAKLPGAADWEFEVFFRADIDRVRAYSRSQNSPAWTRFYGEMGETKVLKKLLRRLPQAVGAPPELPAEFENVDTPEDLAGVIEADQNAYRVVDRGTGEIVMPSSDSPQWASDGNDHNEADTPRPRQRRPRAQQPPPEPEPETVEYTSPQEPLAGAQGVIEMPDDDDEETPF